MGKLYFAYGSNMDKDQMANRCPESNFAGTALLKDYRFIINRRGIPTSWMTYNIDLALVAPT